MIEKQVGGIKAIFDGLPDDANVTSIEVRIKDASQEQCEAIVAALPDEELRVGTDFFWVNVDGLDLTVYPADPEELELEPRHPFLRALKREREEQEAPPSAEPGHEGGRRDVEATP